MQITEPISQASCKFVVLNDLQLVSHELAIKETTKWIPEAVQALKYLYLSIWREISMHVGLKAEQ